MDLQSSAVETIIIYCYIISRCVLIFIFLCEYTYFITHPCVPTVGIFHVIQLCDMDIHIAHLISHRTFASCAY